MVSPTGTARDRRTDQSAVAQPAAHSEREHQLERVPELSIVALATASPSTSDVNECATQLGLHWAVLNEIPQASRVAPQAGATLWLTLPPGRDAATIDRTTGDLMPNPVTILLVEDNPDDEALTAHALRIGTTANIEVARNGQQALDYLFSDANDMPRLVLLDLKLPNIDGLKVLRQIRADKRTSLTPVVILTSVNTANDVAAGYRHGANSYVRKPVDFDQFAELIHQLGLYWLVVNEPPPNVSDH